MENNSCFIYNYQMINAIKMLEKEIKSHAGKDSIKNYLMIECNKQNINKEICLYKINGEFNSNNLEFKVYVPVNWGYKNQLENFKVIVPIKQLLDSLKLYDKNEIVKLSFVRNLKMDFLAGCGNYYPDYNETKLEKKKSLKIPFQSEYKKEEKLFTIPESLGLLIDGVKLNFVSQKGQHNRLFELFEERNLYSKEIDQ